ncbi:MAG: hypothetical protein ABIW82_06230 [Dokdonella sp.]
MAHSLKRRVLAEDVETTRQIDSCARPSCDENRGFHLSRPRPTAGLEALVCAHASARLHWRERHWVLANA